MTPEERAAAILREHDWQHRPTRAADVLAQPALVLIGRHLGDFEVFDQDAKRVGTWQIKRRGWRSFHYALLDLEAVCVLKCRGTFGRLWWAGTFTVRDTQDVERAALDRMHWHPWHTIRPVVANGQQLGRLQLPHFPATMRTGANEGRLADRTGRTLATIRTYVGVGDTYLVVMDDRLTGALRDVAVSVSLLWDNRMLA